MSDLKWNFTKFLVSREGEVVKRCVQLLLSTLQPAIRSNLQLSLLHQVNQMMLSCEETLCTFGYILLVYMCILHVCSGGICELL